MGNTRHAPTGHATKAPVANIHVAELFSVSALKSFGIYHLYRFHLGCHINVVSQLDFAIAYLRTGHSMQRAEHPDSKTLQEMMNIMDKYPTKKKAECCFLDRIPSLSTKIKFSWLETAGLTL